MYNWLLPAPIKPLISKSSSTSKKLAWILLLTLDPSIDFEDVHHMFLLLIPFPCFYDVAHSTWPYASGYSFSFSSKDATSLYLITWILFFTFKTMAFIHVSVTSYLAPPFSCSFSSCLTSLQDWHSAPLMSLCIIQQGSSQRNSCGLLQSKGMKRYAFEKVIMI